MTDKFISELKEFLLENDFTEYTGLEVRAKILHKINSFNILDKESEFFNLPISPDSIEKTPYNKLDINPTGRDFGLTFE